MDDNLRNLLKSAVEDPSVLDKLSDKEVKEALASINPYAGVHAIKKTGNDFAVISHVNTQQKYMEKFLITALIGYLYRCAYEAIPHANVAEIEQRYRTHMQNANAADIAGFEKKKKAELDLVTSTYQRIITAFLDNLFRFNPDKHLRTAHNNDWDKDPERENPAELLQKKVSHIAEVCKIESVLNDRAKETNVASYVKQQILTTYNNAISIINECNKLLLKLPESDEKYVVASTRNAVLKTKDDLAKIAIPLSNGVTIEALSHAPPDDTFYNFNRFLEAHYSQIQDITRVCYAEKPDFENALVYHGSFPTEETAKGFLAQHSDEFRLPTSCITKGHVVLTGPFKKNIDRVEFYGKNNEVIRQFSQKLEQDHKLGKDLMEKKVKREKMKNIKEAGEDDPGLKQYIGSINTIKELGAKQILTSEEKEKLQAAIMNKEDYEVPENAIQMDMFYTDENGQFARKKLYSQTEKPLHIEQDSPYAEQYQPKNDENGDLSDNYLTKQITSRTGEVKTITVHVKDIKSAESDSKSDS